MLLGTFMLFFHSNSINFHPHQQWMRIPYSPHPCQNLLFVVFLMLAILTVVRWYLIWFWSAFPWRIARWALFHCFMYIFFEKMSIQIFCLFLIGFSFLILICMSSLYISYINLLSNISFANIFSHSVGCFLILLMVSFDVQKLLI